MAYEETHVTNLNQNSLYPSSRFALTSVVSVPSPFCYEVIVVKVIVLHPTYLPVPIHNISLKFSIPSNILIFILLLSYSVMSY